MRVAAPVQTLRPGPAHVDLLSPAAGHSTAAAVTHGPELGVGTMPPAAPCPPGVARGTAAATVDAPNGDRRVMPALPEGSVPRQRGALFSVLVVDGQPLLRDAVVARLRAMGAGMVHEAASLAEARARARASGPCELAVVDLGLPDGSGLDLVAELRSQGWKRIVLIGSAAKPYAVRAAFEVGAQAYLLKSAAAATITYGMRCVLDGGVYVDPTVAPLLVTANHVPDTANIPRELSVRELEVLQLVADGHSNKQIGATLVLSPLTVKSHLARIGHKLGTGDRAHMVALAMRACVIH